MFCMLFYHVFYFILFYDPYIIFYLVFLCFCIYLLFLLFKFFYSNEEEIYSLRSMTAKEPTATTKYKIKQHKVIKIIIIIFIIIIMMNCV